MKKLFFGVMLLALVIGVSIPTMTRAEVNVSIVLPPPIVFSQPPELIVLPDTYVYVVPDINEEIFFYDGFWWRPWEGRWYRSPYYDRGWAYYNNVPSFYFDVDPGWRGYYRDHNWYGHRWNYERIPNQQLQQNWKSWDTNRHWEKQGTWGVQGYQPRPQQHIQELKQQRQQQYQQRPEVQKQKQPQVQQQDQESHERAQPQGEEQRPQVQQPQEHERVQPQRQEQRPQTQQPQQQERGKSERGQEEKQDRR